MDFLGSISASDIAAFSPSALLGIGVLMIFRGKLVPSFYVEKQDKLNEALMEQNKILTEALREANKASDTVIESLPQIPSQKGRTG